MNSQIPRRFFTSDQHIDHANVLAHEPQNRVNHRGEPFLDVRQMNAYLIYSWNDSVKPEDEVFVLGDFSCFKHGRVPQVLSALNGKKTLICGNHDPFFKLLTQGKDNGQTRALELAQAMGWADLKLEHHLDIEGIGRVLLSHFPYAPSPEAAGSMSSHQLRYLNLRPRASSDHSLLLHGHVHGHWRERWHTDKQGNHPMINVGVDVWKMGPVAQEQLVVLFKQMHQTRSF